MRSTPFLQATHVSRAFRAPSGALVEALASVHLALQAGERLAVVGSSGSGKSTLLGLLAGFDRPTTGEISVDGRAINRLSSSALADYRRTCVGVVFQSARLLGHLTAADNVALPLVLSRVARAERNLRVAALLERLGLADRALHYPAELSGGEQQRVALARALANRPRLLLADEPTAGLDQAAASSVGDWLMQLVDDEHLTLVVATHDVQLAARCGNTLRLPGRPCAGLQDAA